MSDFLAILFGFLLGSLSGLVPGIHSNTIASLASSASIDANFLSLFIMSVFAAHISLSFLPAIFIGAPDENTAQSVLPGHRLMQQGKGLDALHTIAASLCIAALLSFLLFPLALQLMPTLYPLIKPHMLPLLLLASAFLLISEKELPKIAKAALVFLLCGVLGILTMNSTMREPLFSVFAGLFAVCGLLAGSKEEKIPAQFLPSPEFSHWKYVFAGVFLGMFSDLLPGIAAPAQIAVFASLFIKIDDAKNYLALVASIAASHAIFAVCAALSFGKAREGSLVVIQQTSGITFQNAPALLGIFALSLGASALLLLLLLRFAPKFDFNKLQQLRYPIIFYLFIVAFLINGLLGVLVLSVSACLGFLPLLLRVRRTHVMGCIIVPSIYLLL